MATRYTRQEFLDRLWVEIKRGRPLVMTGAGNGNGWSCASAWTGAIPGITGSWAGTTAGWKTATGPGPTSAGQWPWGIPPCPPACIWARGKGREGLVIEDWKLENEKCKVQNEKF